jgi:hypothetical protein
MADSDSTNTVDEPTEDPIEQAQNAVMEAKALLECFEVMLECHSSASNYRQTDMLAACSGVIRILDKVSVDLDPQQFRKAVLASETEVATQA